MPLPAFLPGQWEGGLVVCEGQRRVKVSIKVTIAAMNGNRRISKLPLTLEDRGSLRVSQLPLNLEDRGNLRVGQLPLTLEDRGSLRVSQLTLTLEDRGSREHGAGKAAFMTHGDL